MPDATRFLNSHLRSPYVHRDQPIEILHLGRSRILLFFKIERERVWKKPSAFALPQKPVWSVVKGVYRVTRFDKNPHRLHVAINSSGHPVCGCQPLRYPIPSVYIYTFCRKNHTTYSTSRCRISTAEPKTIDIHDIHMARRRQILCCFSDCRRSATSWLATGLNITHQRQAALPESESRYCHDFRSGVDSLNRPKSFGANLYLELWKNTS
jgi:hypothetical protein